MNVDYRILKEDFSRIGLCKGDAVLLHSSYKSMGGVGGGIETVINALLSVIGDTGTLIAPAFTFSYVTEENPVFHYVEMPSCVGAISEYVRHMDGAKRSINPTHSCSVIGAKRDFYVDGHENDRTPIGVHSPIYKLHKDGGKILMLGCSLNSNTSMHGVEEHFRTSYVFDSVPKKYTMVMEHETYDIDYYRHYITQHGYKTKFAIVEDLLDERTLRIDSIHGAKSYLMDAAGLWKTAMEALRRDEFFFVDKVDPGV